MGVFSENAIIGASAAGGYDIDQSLRFNDADTSYLARTMTSAGNRKKWTASFWYKRSLGATVDTPLSAVNGTLAFSNIQFASDMVQMEHYPGSTSAKLRTTRLFRDSSAWYHIVMNSDTTLATADDRMKIYINGVQETDFALRTNPAQDMDWYFNDGLSALEISRLTSHGQYLDGYLAEFYYIDGQALTPASFGETNEDTNQWQAIKYEGSYGTNGFYLKFQDSSALGDDSSGNTNDFSTTNLVATDQVLDSPTNNFCTINSLTESITNRNDFSEGNLRATANDISGNSSAWFTATMGIPPNTGKWYWEFADEIYIDAGNFDGSYADGWGMGLLADDGHAKLFADNDVNNTGWWFSKSNNNVGTVRARGGSTSSENKRVPSTSTGVFKCCYDSDAGSFWFGGDLGWMTKTSTGTPETSDQPGSGNDLWDSGTGVGFSGYTVIPAWATINAGGNLTQLRFNFGQDSTFAGIRSGVSGTAGNPSGGGYGGNTDSEGYGDFFYEVPTGFKALCTDNLPDPSIALPGDHFEAVVYVGDGNSTQEVTTNFQPDLIWNKNRTTAYHHRLFDRVRGLDKSVYSNRTEGEDAFQDYGYPTATSSTSVTVGQGDDSGNLINVNSSNYVMWNWKAGGTAVSNTDGTITSSVSANTTAGFSIVSWTGTGSNATVGHGLSQAPELVINKSRDSAYNWAVQSILFNSASDTNILYLNTTAAEADDTNVFQAAPTASVFSPQGGSWAGIGASGVDYIAYCFHSVEGYSKVGTYSGNSSDDGTFVHTGFRPAWVLIKCYAGHISQEWVLLDNQRPQYNVVNKFLYANASDAEDSNLRNVDFVSNGIKMRSGGTAGTGGPVNISGRDYIYLAFAESPFKTANAR